MSTTFPRDNWKPRATAGNHSPQRELSIHAAAPPSRPLLLVPVGVLVDGTFSDALYQAILYSGYGHEALARRIAISKGYMSKFLGGVAEQWAKRLVKFMTETGSLGPLQWIAQQVGCEVTVLDSRAAEVAELRQRLHELERAA